ncbi:MAG: HD-GYP domain-containing protein [Alkaliphilus sp.]
MNQLPKNAKFYIFSIIVLAVFFSFFLVSNYPMPNIYILLLFIFLSFLTESLTVRFSNEAAVSVSFAVFFSAIVILGPLGAVISSSLGIMLRYVKIADNRTSHILNTSIYKTLFNGAMVTLCVGISSIIFYSFYVYIADPFFYNNMFALSATIFAYLIINTVIITGLFTLLRKKNFFSLFLNKFLWAVPNLLVIAILGVFISLLYLHYGVLIMLLFFAPLLFARHSFQQYIDLKSYYMQTMTALANAVEAKDKYTKGHSERVSFLAEEFGKYMHCSPKRISILKKAGLLHDIGKIGIADSILNKSGSLTDKEMSAIKNHPELGVKILKDINFLKGVQEAILHHHERYDGTGYPHGLSGEQIPLNAAILTVVDAYDAMTSDRAYRDALSTQEAINTLKSETGQFNPKISMKFAEMLLTTKNEKIINLKNADPIECPI